MEKNYNVYTTFEPWMIGEKVEVGIYVKNIDGEPTEWLASNGGILTAYASDDESIEFQIEGTARPASIQNSHTVRISVVEPSP